ncbi:hypothetical protein BDB00DRAFT_807325 [Zychaea mexicana]|uniref:uncharacterized protein n=1 Tax=Zychaea mexicana TaxID=64656 RepID=UPI0022FE62F1|nr:uncharacterized protein BDB00DRAFT_807325 [Zychaea mexicana]KAI9496818.1 hypothetical protein BDB00DRAFT_807325 [Zychaea mexicana]
MRHDVPNQWEELFCNSQQSLVNASYEDALAQCSIALDELTQKTVATLDIRAAALGQSANYDQGLRDAFEMVQLAPSSSKGYLRIGELYAMQGKQGLAIDIYNKGIRTVPETDPGYARLSIQRQLSLDQQNYKIDFITELPFDILPKIMYYLPMHMCVLCVNVSQSWRARIRQCSAVWRKMIIDNSDDDDARVYNNLSYVSDQVRELSLRGFDEYVPSQFLKTLELGRFTRLQSLALRRIRITSANNLLQGLEHINGTLKNLALISIRNDPVTLDAVLSICTNLLTFKYKGMGLQISRPSKLPAATRIVSLELETTSIIRAAQLEPLLRCCPAVQNLYVYRSEPSAIRLIDQYSTAGLRSLAFNLYRIMDDITHIDSHDSNMSMIPKGLRSLHVSRVEAVAAVNLAPLLMKSNDTLEELVLYMDDDVGPVQLWNPLTTFTLPRLQKLQCEVRPMMQHVIATLVRQCPELEDVTFEHCEYIGNEIFGALAGLTQLRRIATYSVSEINEVGLVQLLERHVALQHHSPLRVFETDDYSNITDEALACLADIPTLERIRLDACNQVSADGIELFVQKLKPDCALQILLLYNMEAVPDTAIQGLCKLEHLRHVELVRLKSITDQSIADLVSSSLSLQSMWIYDCALVTKYMIKQAKLILEGKF